LVLKRGRSPALIIVRVGSGARPLFLIDGADL
jgi:hypothetical protein